MDLTSTGDGDLDIVEGNHVYLNDGMDSSVTAVSFLDRLLPQVLSLVVSHSVISIAETINATV